MAEKESRKPQRGGMKAAAAAFALIGVAALGFSLFKWRERYVHDHPPPLPNVIAPIPPDQVAVVSNGMRLLSKTVLQCTPDQQEKLAAIWDKPPRSVEELIQYHKKTDQILTPEQVAKLKPIRKGFQDKVVDKMLEPARDRFTADDFKKFSTEVKARVETRISGQ